MGITVPLRRVIRAVSGVVQAVPQVPRLEPRSSSARFLAAWPSLECRVLVVHWRLRSPEAARLLEAVVGRRCRVLAHTPTLLAHPAPAVDPAGGGHAVRAAMDDCGIQEGRLQRALPR